MTASARSSRSLAGGALTVFRKEIVDALRDRRTLLVVLMSSVLMGPLVLIALSSFIAGLESRAEQREVVIDGAAHAPTLVNYLQRQTYTVQDAPADYEQQLRSSRLANPVVKVPEDFEAALQRGEAPLIEVVSDGANQRAEVAATRVRRLLAGFNTERGLLALALRGVAPDVQTAIEVQDRDLASTQTRASRVTAMLPFVVMLAVLYGALTASLDTTAGERERGSLEPLLMNPTPRWSLVLGKWGAVASIGFLIAILSCFSFLPAQSLLRSDSLQAMFRFGADEALLFLVVLLPHAAALSALLMVVAIRCRTFKEAQANTAVVVMAMSLLPMVTLFNDGGEAAWHFWTPAIAQFTLMTRVLKGETFGLEHLAPVLLVSTVLTVACLWLVTRMLRQAALK